MDPDSEAARQARAWSASRPADARLMQRIASQSQADWFGDWNHDVRGDVAERVDRIRRAGALPVLVAYDIPHRDCSGSSAGGAPTPQAYRGWIRGLAAGIGSRAAAVILEPDALAGLGCLSEGDQRSRVALLADAVHALATLPHVAVYLDAGNSTWEPARVVARRLRAAGVDAARGFSLNVSNFNWTANEIAYGREISQRLGGTPFVVDTSRNGLGPAPSGAWCNPTGRALGPPPSTRTGDALVDALLWIKTPGESDGSCAGGPQAGQWWPDYALGLAARRSLVPAP